MRDVSFTVARGEVFGFLGPNGARMWHRPCLDFQREQHVHALEQHGVDVQEVAGKDAVCPGAREPPTR